MSERRRCLYPSKIDLYLTGRGNARGRTLPIRAALPAVLQLPIIQLLGNNGPAHFRTAPLFARLYVEWAEEFGFGGWTLHVSL